MEYNFSSPRKQSASGIIVMFANNLQKAVRAIALPVIFIIVKSKGAGNLTLILIGLSVVLTLALAVFAYLSYQKFTFFLDGEKEEFIINEGVFNKTTLSIQLNKIQQVNISQSLLQRVIGVYSLDIDTAGSEKKEASIKAIDHAMATHLKQRLLSRDASQTSPETGIASNVPPLLELSTSTLFKVGITSNYGASLLLLSGFIFGAFQLFKDYTDAFEIEREQFSQTIIKGFNFFSICFLLILALVVILSTNIIRTFVKYFNFQIVRQKRSLAISSGLFNRKNTLLKPNKVQLTAYSQNYFQKKFNILNMKIRKTRFF
jgi:putative membrane protein